MASRVRIEFVSEGFMGVLKSEGVAALLNSVAAKSKARCEDVEGIPYEVRQSSAWDGRPRVLVRARKPLPRPERVRNLTHERWMSDIWPKVGGPPYRRNR